MNASDEFETLLSELSSADLLPFLTQAELLELDRLLTVPLPADEFLDTIPLPVRIALLESLERMEQQNGTVVDNNAPIILEDLDLPDGLKTQLRDARHRGYWADLPA